MPISEHEPRHKRTPAEANAQYYKTVEFLGEAAVCHLDTFERKGELALIPAGFDYPLYYNPLSKETRKIHPDVWARDWEMLGRLFNDIPTNQRVLARRYGIKHQRVEHVVNTELLPALYDQAPVEVQEKYKREELGKGLPVSIETSANLSMYRGGKLGEILKGIEEADEETRAQILEQAQRISRPFVVRKMLERFDIDVPVPLVASERLKINQEIDAMANGLMDDREVQCLLNKLSRSQCQTLASGKNPVLVALTVEGRKHGLGLARHAGEIFNNFIERHIPIKKHVDYVVSETTTRTLPYYWVINNHQETRELFESPAFDKYRDFSNTQIG